MNTLNNLNKQTGYMDHIDVLRNNNVQEHYDFVDSRAINQITRNGTPLEIKDILNKKTIEVGGEDSATLQKDLEVNITVGGIQAGTVFEKGTSVEKVLRKLLFTDEPIIRGKIYYGSSANIPTEIGEYLTEKTIPLDFSTNGLKLNIATNGEYAIVAYPKSYSKLNTIYQGIVPINICENWNYIEVTHKGLEYYLYYDTSKTWQTEQEGNYTFKIN